MMMDASPVSVSTRCDRFCAKNDRVTGIAKTNDLSTGNASLLILQAFRLPDDPGGGDGHRMRRSIASRLLLLFERKTDATNDAEPAKL